MDVSIRPWFTTGVALVGAGAIALTPISPVAPARPMADVAQVSAAVARDFQLTAIDWPYILSLPIVRQNIVNTIENWAVYLGGFAKSGVGLAQSLLALPSVTIEALQQALALDFVGAFDTIATGVRDTVIAVGQPLLDSIIWRNQKAALVQAALSSAVPLAYISVVNGFLTAANGVTSSLIVGTQDFIAALATLNLSNIVNAAIQGTQNFVMALGAGAGAIVGGIEDAQRGIVAALATTPPPPPAFAVSDVSTMSTFSEANTLTLSRTSASVDAKVAEPAVVADTEPVVVKDETPVVDTPVDVVPEKTPATSTPDPTPVKVVESTPDPVTPEKTPAVTSVKDTVTAVKDPVKDTVKEPEKVTAGSSAPGNDKPASPKKDDDGGSGAGADKASSSGGES